MTKAEDTTLAQYEIMVNSSLEVSGWRNSTNQFYLAVNTALLALAGYFQSTVAYISLLFCLAGITISIVWFQNIESYKKLNSAKFKVIQEMERKLPYAMFAQEEAYYKEAKRKDFTSFEKWVPLLFGALYFIFLVIAANRLLVQY